VLNITGFSRQCHKKLSTSKKVRMLRCAASFVVAAYVKVRLTPQALRALPAETFYEAADFEKSPDAQNEIDCPVPENGLRWAKRMPAPEGRQQ
jgi:hypothetical protein